VSDSDIYILDSFSEHVRLDAGPGAEAFTRIFFCGLYPNIPTTKNRCTRQLKIEGNPLFLEHVQMQGMGDQLAPIDHLVSSPLFLVEKESSSPSIYS
jgi:hypothetical protein